MAWAIRRGRIVALGLALGGAVVLAVEAFALGDGSDGRIGLFGRRDPRVLYRAAVDARVVALTIDDGPDLETTPEILEVLREVGATATFFVIADRVPGEDAMLARIVAEGHELGNHMTRDEPSIELDPERFERELVRAHADLSRHGEVSWFRPGSGYYDDAMLDIVERHGYRTALGWVYPLDAHLPWSWLARTWIRWQAGPGSIVILHDGGARGRRTASTLRGVVPRLRAAGYRFVSLSELVEIERGEADEAR